MAKKKENKATSFVSDLQKDVVETLKKSLGRDNEMNLPKIKYISINSGVGKNSNTDKNFITFASEAITQITGQKPAERIARKSISNFKLREGSVVGLVCTLRGPRMIDFIVRLNNFALPRSKDFRGLSVSSFDRNGNYSLGIKDFRIFPEVQDQDLTKRLGLQVNVVIDSDSVEESEELLRAWKFPLKKRSKKKS